jgi:hypothetical protein
MWQRDALRRLLTTDALAGSDLSELADLACPELSATDKNTLTATIATDEHVPISTQHLPAVRLTSISDIENVNALSAGPVWFGTDGLTVIYGNNGSGKSGVARILKKACRARDPGGAILPNVFEPSSTDPAAATIDYVLGTDAKSHHWVQNQATDPNLSAVNIFDSKCAAMQIEQANEISYTPPIIKVFADLANIT